MKSTGRQFAALALLILGLLGSQAQAALTAAADRTQIALGDTLRLEVTATEGEDLNAISLIGLDQDFEILQRSSSSSVNVINGKRSARDQLILTLTPRRTGQLTIPTLTDGNAKTQALTIKVDEAPSAPSGGDSVVFSAELDKSSVYVQGQLLLTLRIQQAVNLDARSVSELQIEGAFVKSLDQQSFQRTIDGRPWLVHEVRYAIFPEKSGTLEIPSQTFSARESSGRRSLFDRNTGRQVHRVTQPLSVEVLPRPANYPAGATWLPSSGLTIEEAWSTPPDQLQVGESVTRTIRVTGHGLQGAQLPPVMFPATQGLKYYPDQPEITEQESSQGLTGTRIDSAALVPTNAGTYPLAEIRIPWWDTTTNTMQEAVLPARSINVAPAAARPAAPPTGTDSATPENIAPEVVTGNFGGNARYWQIAAAACAVGWLLTFLWGWRRGGAREQTPPSSPATMNSGNEAAALKRLLAACATHQGTAARRALLDWGRCRYPALQDQSLDGLTQQIDDPAFSAQVARLEQALYSGDSDDWDGTALAARVKILSKSAAAGSKGSKSDDLLSLYPA